jgi:WD40 repeat protein
MNHLKPMRWLAVGIVGTLLLSLSTEADAQKKVKPGKGIAEPAASPAAQAQGNPGPATTRLIARLGTDQLRHGSRILCLTYSPDGQVLAAGGGSDPVRLWDTKTGQQKLTCPETWVNAIVFTPRGSVMFTGGAFKTIRMWETANGKEEAKLNGHNAPVKALALSIGGQTLASGSQDGVIILWEVSTKKKITEIKDHTDEITCLAFSQLRGEDEDSALFVSSSNDRTVRVWDANTNQLKQKIDAGCGVLAVAISKDGKHVFAAGDDNLIRVWDVDTGKLADTLKGHDGMVVSLAVSRDGKTMVSGGRDKSMRLWNLEDLKAAPRVIQRHLGDSDALALTRDGKRVATAGLNNTIRMFDTASGKELFAADQPQAALTGLVVSRDGKTLAAVTAPGIVYLWDAVTGQRLRDWATGHVGDISLAYTPDGQSIVTAADTIRFWDPQTGKQRFELPGNGTKKTPVVSIAFTPDGKTLAAGMHNHDVVLWDVDAKKEIGSIKCSGTPYALAFSTDSALLAASGDSKIVICDRTGKELRRFECKDAPPKTILPDVAALAFSADKKTIAAACYDGVIRILDFMTGKELGVCEGHASVPYSIAYSHDGRTLLSGSFDASVRLWEPFSGAQLGELKAHAGPVYGVALSPDGKIAYSAGADTNVAIWDATGFGKAGPPKAAWMGNELDQAWKDLASDNAGAARQVIWRLIANPQDVATAMKKQVHLVDVARINKLIGDLDSDEFDTREAATKELASQGRWLEGRLKEALEKPPSLEYKRRVEQLIDKLGVPGALTLRQEQLRMRRAMMVLEYIADDGSIDLLGKLSKQAPEEAFRHEAQVTLQRMGKTAGKVIGGN